MLEALIDFHLHIKDTQQMKRSQIKITPTQVREQLLYRKEKQYEAE